MYPRLFQRRNKPSSSQNSNLTSILAKTERYFVPVRDISTVKHSFHSILHAECSACPSQRWNKPGRSQNAFFRRFWRKLAVTLFLFEIYRRLNALVVVTTSENDPWLSCRMSWWGSRGGGVVGRSRVQRGARQRLSLWSADFLIMQHVFFALFNKVFLLWVIVCKLRLLFFKVGRSGFSDHSAIFSLFYLFC